MRAMQQTPLWTDWNIRHVATHRDGSAAAKIAAFARGALLFVVELIRFRPGVVHLHASSGASFVRKGILFWISRLARVPVVVHMHGSGFPGVLREFTAGDPGGDPCDAPPGERRRRARRGVGGPAAGDCPDRADNGNPQRGSTRPPHCPARTGRVRARGFPRPHRRSQGHIQAARRVGRLARDPDFDAVSGRRPP